MPTLDLPMYKNPGRVVHALLSSAQDMEQMIMLKAMMQKLFFNNDHEQPAAQTYGYENEMSFTSPFGNIKKQGNNKYEMMEQMMKTFMNHKNKRAADDVFELGDRLTEKLK